MRRDDHMFPKNGSGIFFADGLDAFLILRSDLPDEADQKRIDQAIGTERAPFGAACGGQATRAQMKAHQ